MRGLLPVLALIVVCGDQSVAAVEISFNREIRPLLSDACFACHGPDAAHREADLRLDLEASAKEDAIVPGDVEASELIARITSDDPDLLMPPPDSGKQVDFARNRSAHRMGPRRGPLRTLLGLSEAGRPSDSRHGFIMVQ